MTITFYNNASDNIVVNKALTELFRQTGTLRSQCSILDPDILIERANLDLTKCNYIYIADFNRYYYIKNITSIANNLWSISAHVDVLMSYKDDIIKLNALIARQESKINKYLPNAAVPILAQKTVKTIPITGISFSTNDIAEHHAGMGDNNTTLVLVTVGTGATAT